MSHYRFKGKKVDLEELRAGLRKMPDEELLRFAEAVERSMEPDSFALKGEVRAEWTRRHSSTNPKR